MAATSACWNCLARHGNGCEVTHRWSHVSVTQLGNVFSGNQSSSFSQRQNSCKIHLPPPSFTKSYLPSSFFRLNYLLAGGLHPVGFHVLNIILHAVISALMIDVFAILTGGLAYDEKGRMLNNAPKTSLLASLFFAAHPVHTESVSKAV